MLILSVEVMNLIQWVKGIFKDLNGIMVWEDNSEDFYLYGMKEYEKHN